jgi:hypothetical protein
MIQIKYCGRLGNHLLQFCFARILSLELNQYLPKSPIKFFPYTGCEFNLEFKNEWGDPRLTLKGTTLFSIDKIKNQMELKGAKNILLRDTCGNYNNFVKYKNEIKNTWLNIDQPYIKNNLGGKPKLFVKKNGVLEAFTVNEIYDDDIIINVRLGDIESKHAGRLLTFDYFKIILDNIKYNRLFIAPEDMNSKLLLPFDKYDPIYFVQDNYMDTFNFVRMFNRIVISQSTYCWWIAYLSNAQEVYFPIPEIGPWAISSTKWANEDLRVDEDRYIYVSQKNEKILGRYCEIKKWE